MGREIRMVPPNWDHPKNERGHLQPMFDKTFADAATEWKLEFAEWESGKRPDYCDDPVSRALEFWEWHGSPPNREYYRPYADADATWFQLWETVSEGTPVSPPFATREELAAYLAGRGDDWDQKRGNGGWGKKSADAFVLVGWAPTAMSRGSVFLESKDIPAALEGTDAAR